MLGLPTTNGNPCTSPKAAGTFTTDCILKVKNANVHVYPQTELSQPN
jgi:hypothetical protein